MEKRKINPQVFSWLLFFLFTFLFWAVRLWRFEELMGFQADQALHLQETWQMITDRKIRLVGPLVSSKVVLGRGFFVGPFYYYLLAVLGLLAGWDVVLITKLCLFFWWLAAVLIMVWLGKKYSQWIGLLSYGIFAVSPQLVEFSRKIWNPNFFPLIGVFFFWLFSDRKRGSFWRWFGLGFFFGLGISFDYSAFLWFFFLPVLMIKEWREGKFNFHYLGFCFLGAVISELPLLIFELRNDFYNLRTIWFVFRYGILAGQSGFHLAFFHFFLPLVPVIFWALTFFLSQIEKRWGRVKMTALTLLAITFLTSKIDFQGQWSETIAMGWDVPKQKEVADWICRDAGGKEFEVASTISGDTRAPELRWWLSQKNCPSMGVEDYPQAGVLYLVAPSTRPPEEETVWEISSLRPFFIVESRPVSEQIIFYKLVRGV